MHEFCEFSFLQSLSVNDKVEKDKKLWIKWLEQYFARLMKEIGGISQDKIAEVCGIFM